MQTLHTFAVRHPQRGAAIIDATQWEEWRQLGYTREGGDPLTLPKFLRPELFAGRIGIVLGNGPQIDLLPPEFWKAVAGDAFVTAGVNRICCAEVCVKAEFCPTLHFIGDYPLARDGSWRLALESGLRRLAHKSIRCAIATRGWPQMDEPIYRDIALLGACNAAPAGWPSVQTVANILYRCGCRAMYLYGVELNSDAHCRTIPPITGDVADVARADFVERSSEHFRQLAALPDLKLFCCAPDSRLVRDGILPFSEGPLAIAEDRIPAPPPASVKPNKARKPRQKTARPGPASSDAVLHSTVPVVQPTLHAPARAKGQGGAA